MRDPRPRSGSPSWLRLPRRTARLRLTLLYGGACLVFGAILLAVTYLLTWGALTVSAVPQPAAAAGRSPLGRWPEPSRPLRPAAGPGAALE